MKIAIIGCSHFAVTEQPTQGKHNWSYQLYRLYPHHQYRNYSMGGQGIEQFQWSLLDAKKWGAEASFRKSMPRCFNKEIWSAMEYAGLFATAM